MEVWDQKIWEQLSRLEDIMKTLQNNFEQQSFLIGRLTARVNTLEASRNKK